jgi:hypothetical protein
MAWTDPSGMYGSNLVLTVETDIFVQTRSGRSGSANRFIIIGRRTFGRRSKHVGARIGGGCCRELTGNAVDGTVVCTVIIVVIVVVVIVVGEQIVAGPRRAMIGARRLDGTQHVANARLMDLGAEKATVGILMGETQ